MFTKGIKCPLPPPLPPNYVCRKHLLDETVTKLFQTTIEPDSYGTSLTVTGAGGFGKTLLVTALCHHILIKKQFRDGIVFIELGPQATDPSVKLSQLYHSLTGQYLKQGDINLAEQELNRITSLYCRNLLVIIDDVWHIEDAEPIVKAFSNCKIVLTTRMNHIEQYIPTKQVVTVGPMEQTEAISLLTYRVIDINNLSQKDAELLNELSQDVDRWPLLLSLIRGQLCHVLKRHHTSYHEAIQTMQVKLLDKGLTAFDRSNNEKGRKYAARICLDVTLGLLTESLLCKIKTLILYTGIGSFLQAAVLHSLWNVTENEARDIVDNLWSYSLVQFTYIIIPPHNKEQPCVEVHSVISQYIFEHMASEEVRSLAPCETRGTYQSVGYSLADLHQKAYGIDTIYPLTPKDYLKYRLSEIENYHLPYYLKLLNMHAMYDPHRAILVLQAAKQYLQMSPNVKAFIPATNTQIHQLEKDCHEALKCAVKLNRKLNQNVQHCIANRNYQKLIRTIEAYICDYPIGLVTQRAVTILNTTKLYCDGAILHNIVFICEEIQMLASTYHYINLVISPLIKLYLKELEEIRCSFISGTSEIERINKYYTSGENDRDSQLIIKKWLEKVQEIAPNHANIT